MKSISKILILIFVLVASFALGALAFDTIFGYWIVGTIPDNGVIKADGRDVVLYKNDGELALKHFVRGRVIRNAFFLNEYSLWPNLLLTGNTFKISTVKTPDGFGADGQGTFSGKGWDEVTGLVLRAGGGIDDPGQPVTKEPSPEIKVWFGNRLYQPEFVAKGEEFIVSKKPKIKFTVSISEPYALDASQSYSIALDAGSTNARTLSIQSSHITAKTVATAIKALTISYPMEEELSDGAHTFTFSARSAGALGAAASSGYRATVTVKSGPASIVGEPLVFPSPYSPTKHMSGLEIQYTLTADTDIDIYLFSIAGAMIQKISCMAGTEGGSAGLNKVKWDGKIMGDKIIGNGIYLGTIVSKAEGRLLKKFKLNVFD